MILYQFRLLSNQVRKKNTCYVVYGHPMKFYDYFNVKSEFYGQNYYQNSFLGRFCINFDFFPTFVWSGITVRCDPNKKKPPRSRTLTAVYDVILNDLVLPAEVVKLDGSQLIMVHLDNN